jgi:hypothetical protein
LYLFTVIAVVFHAPQMNELKLHAEEQGYHIAALTGITLPERAARIKTLPSLVAVSALATTVLVLVSIVQVLEVSSSPNQEAVAGVFDFSAFWS